MRISGASPAIAQAFRREGAKVILTYQGERLRQTVEELGAEIGAEKIFDCDVTKPEVWLGWHSRVRLDIVVHSIAFANREDLSRPFVERRATGSVAQEVSVYSLVSVARATAPLTTEGGALMTLTYLGSTRVVTNYNVMGIAKAGLEATVRYLASELGEKKIRVNAISAGPVKTASARGIKGLSKILELVQAKAPLRRNTDPAEVADMAVFLGSDLGRGVTGDVLFVDAGFHIMGM